MMSERDILSCVESSASCAACAGSSEVLSSLAAGAFMAQPASARIMSSARNSARNLFICYPPVWGCREPGTARAPYGTGSK